MTDFAVGRIKVFNRASEDIDQGQNSMISTQRLSNEGTSRLDALHEREVVATFADLTQAPSDSSWGPGCSTTVVFDRSSNATVEKWQLPAQEGLSQLIAMPRVTRECISQFVEDIAADLQHSESNDDMVLCEET